MGTGTVLLKGHRHRPLGITGLGGGQRLTAALPRVQGKGLQRQTAEQQQGRAGERQGKGKPPLLWIKPSHTTSTNAG
tara:strand:- start:599 stop:829 length:231 start_codon:yes stop_codon:yes gene_type:complete